MSRRPDGRIAGWPVLRAGLVAVGLTAVRPSGQLSAQVSVHLGAGARYGTALIRDSIVVPIELRPGIAPALLLSVRDDLRGPWAADATLDITPSGLQRHEAGSSVNAGSVTAVAFSVGLRRTFANGLTGRLAIGGLSYTGSSEGAFRDGSGGLIPLGSVAASYTLRGFTIDVRYDVHRFITPALRAMRFNNPRPVHRVALTVSRRILGADQTP